MKEASTGKTDEPVEDVCDWASRLTAEARISFWTVSDYYWPTEVKLLHARLLQAQRQLIAVLGCQGVGKTSAMQALVYEFNRDFWRRLVKSKNVKKSMVGLKRQVFSSNLSEIRDFLDVQRSVDSLQFFEFASSYAEELNKILRVKRFSLPLVPPQSMDDAEVLLGKAKSRKARMVSLLETAPQFQHILIDLPDYSKTDRRMMAKDLGFVQMLWRSIMNRSDRRTNLVLFMQEETFRDRFFLGKMEVARIKPFTAQQLISAYKQKFKICDPFTEQAVLQLARLSRGIFRRFLQYIKLCLDHQRQFGGEPGLLDEEFVGKVVTKEQLGRDLYTELSQLFPRNPEAHLLASDIFTLLSQNPPLSQKAIAQQLQLPEYKLSRIMIRLEAARLIRREKVGLEKVVRLAESF